MDNGFLDFVGCRLNEAEIEAIARKFSAVGHRVVASSERANTFVLNTRTVTNDAARKSRQLILQAARTNPSAKIVATGCYAEFDSAKVASLPGVSYVISNRQ